MVVMLPTPHGAYSGKEQSEREGEVGESGRNTTRFLRRESGASPPNAGLPLSLVPWASHLDVNLPLLPPQDLGSDLRSKSNGVIRWSFD